MSSSAEGHFSDGAITYEVDVPPPFLDEHRDSALYRLLKLAATGAPDDEKVMAMYERVAEVFEMIGFNNLFRIFATSAEAAAALAKTIPAQQ